MTPRELRDARACAAVLDDPDGRARVYGAAMLALAFCASPEGFGRFRRWLGDQASRFGDLESLGADRWSPEAVHAASRVLAARTILDQQGDGDPS